MTELSAGDDQSGDREAEQVRRGLRHRHRRVRGHEVALVHDRRHDGRLRRPEQERDRGDEEGEPRRRAPMSISNANGTESTRRRGRRRRATIVTRRSQRSTSTPASGPEDHARHRGGGEDEARPPGRCRVPATSAPSAMMWIRSPSRLIELPHPEQREVAVAHQAQVRRLAPHAIAPPARRRARLARRWRRPRAYGSRGWNVAGGRLPHGRAAPMATPRRDRRLARVIEYTMAQKIPSASSTSPMLITSRMIGTGSGMTSPNRPPAATKPADRIGAQQEVERRRWR